MSNIEVVEIREETILVIEANGGQEIVVVTEAVVEVSEVGIQGPAGPQGSGYGIYTAGATLSGHRIVRLNSSGQASYASNDVPSDGEAALGLTLGAAAIGGNVSVQRVGDIAEPSWVWTPGEAIYLGTSGQLTQIPPIAPAAVFLLVVGFAISATRAFIDVQTPVFLT